MQIRLICRTHPEFLVVSGQIRLNKSIGFFFYGGLGKSEIESLKRMSDQERSFLRSGHFLRGPAAAQKMQKDDGMDESFQ